MEPYGTPNTMLSLSDLLSSICTWELFWRKPLLYIFFSTPEENGLRFRVLRFRNYPLEQSANTNPEISSRLTDCIMSSRTPRRVLVVECPFPKPGNLIETNNLRVVPLVLDELSRTFEMIVLYEIVQETYNKKRSIIEQGFHLTWESNRKLVINLPDFHSMSYFSGA